MAEKRMFAKSIVLSDAFLDMPMSSRCLYFTLSMGADDDGFVNSPKSIMRQCGASDDDLRILLTRNFLIPFESGVVVIKHWRINNYLRSDRYSQTNYLKEKNSLIIEKNGAYSLTDNICKQLRQIEEKSISDKNTILISDTKINDSLLQREPKNDIEIIEKQYLENYKLLYNEGVLRLENPVINWNVSRKLIKERLNQYGVSVVLEAVKASMLSNFCISKGYVLTTILSSGVFASLVNTNSSDVTKQIQEEKKREEKEQRDSVKETHPKNCSYCGTELVDSSGGVKASWFCMNCRKEWVLKNNEWVEE